MTAYDVVQRARGLADLQSTDFITYNDVLNSINEAYRDIYSEITESNDDYFLKEVIISLSSAYLVPNGNTWEYELPLPEDFYKARYIDYKYNGVWQPVNKFPLSSKDINPSQPMYRWRANKLWIVGSFGTTGGEIRLGYYPPQETLSVPDQPLTYLTSLPAYDGPRISYPEYIESGNNYMYIEKPGTNYILKTESKSSNVTSTLYTSATATTNLVYYKGYVYLLNSTANIIRGTTNLTSTVVPAAITTSNDVTSFTINNNLIYFTTATDTKTCNLDGTGTATIAAGSVQKNYCFINDTYPVYTIGGVLYINSVNTGITGVTRATSDNTFVYVLIGTSITKYLFDMTGAIVSVWLLYTGVSAMGKENAGRLPVIFDEEVFQAVSTAHDSALTYPLNIVPEMISYQAAIDFRRKQNADPSLLIVRLKELTETFKEAIMRDSYQVERIKNFYAGGSIFQYN